MQRYEPITPWDLEHALRGVGADGLGYALADLADLAYHGLARPADTWAALVERLLALGANPNPPRLEDDESPLARWFAAGDVAAVSLLLRAGARFAFHAPQPFLDAFLRASDALRARVLAAVPGRLPPDFDPSARAFVLRDGDLGTALHRGVEREADAPLIEQLLLLGVSPCVRSAPFAQTAADLARARIAELSDVPPMANMEARARLIDRRRARMQRVLRVLVAAERAWARRI